MKTNQTTHVRSFSLQGERHLRNKCCGLFKTLIFSKKMWMQRDGGWGFGSQPQHHVDANIVLARAVLGWANKTQLLIWVWPQPWGGAPPPSPPRQKKLVFLFTIFFFDLHKVVEVCFCLTFSKIWPNISKHRNTSQKNEAYLA